MALLCLPRKYERIFLIPSEKPTPTIEDFKRKWQILLTDIGCECYLNSMCNPKPPTNKTRLHKKKQEEEYKIKFQLKVGFDHWKDRKFQISWKKWNVSFQSNVIPKNPFISLIKDMSKRFTTR